MEFTDVDELVVAQGDNLQERKRLLWETCDCVVVLPGGTGRCVCVLAWCCGLDGSFGCVRGPCMRVLFASGPLPLEESVGVCLIFFPVSRLTPTYPI